MTKRRPIGAKDPPVKADGEDDLTRLIRTIARQAAQEAFNLVRDAFETPLAPAGSPCGPPELENRPDNSATKTNPSPEPGERFLKRRRSGREARRFAENGAANDRSRRLARAPDRPARSSRRTQPCRLPRQSEVIVAINYNNCSVINHSDRQYVKFMTDFWLALSRM